MWDLPSNKALAHLRTQVIKAIWGKGRRMRCPEIVLGVLNDQTRTDPMAAIIYKRLADARRILNKDKDRLRKALRVQQQTKAEETKIFNNQGPIAGLRQAATLLGGQLEAKEGGLVITFSGDFLDLPINEGKQQAWKWKAKAAITNALTMQLNARTKHNTGETVETDTCKESEGTLDSKFASQVFTRTPRSGGEEEVPTQKKTEKR